MTPSSAAIRNPEAKKRLSASMRIVVSGKLNSCMWPKLPFGSMRRLAKARGGRGSIKTPRHRYGRNGINTAPRIRIRAGLASPIIVILGSHQNAAELLCYQHQRDAGDEAEERIKTECMLDREGTVFRDEQVDQQQQGTNRVEPAHQPNNIRRHVEPINLVT